ncbi:YbbR domain-containing protein [Kroppenstedtia sanguinis]|uniref:YbbR-like domain-containing protein n=1 Tax=Kroppenstedtia sanguinis TaxID=1380684 RepID=A0ABW4CDA2_9BACL
MDKWLQNNNVIKLVALLLAVMLWLIVNDEGNLFHSKQVDHIVTHVPLTVLYDEDRLAIRKMPDSVDLYLRGHIPSMKRVTPSHFEAYVDLRNQKEGIHRDLPVKVRGVPGGVEAEVRPQRVEVTLESKRSRVIPVETEVIGHPKPGYKVGKPVAKPERVEVKGTRSDLEKVRRVRAVVNAEGATETISRSVSLQVYGEDGELNGIEVHPQKVDVEIPVASPHVQLPLTVQYSGVPPKEWAVESVKTEPDQVTVYGTKNYLTGLKTYPGPVLDLSGMNRNRTIVMEIPVGGDAVQVKPEQITLDVKVVKGKEKTFQNLPVEIRGAKGEAQVEIVSGNQVDLTLFGAPRRLKGLKPGDLKAYVDLSKQKKPGEYEVPVLVETPDFIRMAEGPSPTVTVRVE